MDAWKIILAAALLFLAIAFFVFQPQPVQPSPSTIPSPSIVSTPSPSVQTELECSQTLALALNSSNPSLCESISCSEMNAYCKGILGKSASSCANAGSLKNDCFLKIALESKDSRFCESISDSEKKGFCLGIVSKDASHCLAMEKSFSRDWCLFESVKASRNASLCGFMENEGYKENCLRIAGSG